jgi:hypothetical protein
MNTKNKNNIRAVITASIAAGIFAALAIGTPQARGSIIISYAENPGEMETQVQATTAFDFNDLKKNTQHTDVAWGTVGTIDQIYVSASNVYGGATTDGDPANRTNTNYGVQSTSIGAKNATPTTTISFGKDQAYFGFWWSAGDGANTLQFYNKGELIADYSTETLLGIVAADVGYLGNPTKTYLGQNNREAYAYINVFGMEGSNWDTIVMSNNGSSGFETDNWATREPEYGTLKDEDPKDLPGKPAVLITDVKTITNIPEPGAALLGAIGLIILLRRRHR